MKIGILELLCENINRSILSLPHDFFVVKQYASIMPQAVSTWCRQMGHEVVYNTYFGFKSPERLLPDDLDVIFISCFSRGSALAYALAKLFKKKSPKVLMILGGPHAKQFSHDAIRFYDVVIKNCDQQLIKEILTDLPKKEIVTTSRTLKDIPCIEERMPDIQKSFFWRSKPNPFVFVPILSSIGCPYSCDFCVDWNNEYHLFPLDCLEKDLTYAAKHFPQVRINFYDPNFGVEFDRVMEVIEKIDHPKKRWFLTEGSLDSLTKERLIRLEKAGCLCVIPGIESWTAYSKKTGVGRPDSAMEKLNHIVDRFKMIHQHIPITQANLLFGLDMDKGQDPVTLNKTFISRTPWVSHSLNIPAPFGETPMFNRYLKQNRILETLPFTFYCKPYLATTIKHYSPIEFYEKLIDTFSFITSPDIQTRGFRLSKSLIHKAYQPIRTTSLKIMIHTMKQILTRLKQDRRFRYFHEKKTQTLPEFYHRKYEALLGPYKDLVSRSERIPRLAPEHEHHIKKQRKCA
ncbi:MAG: hypothetical protein L3J69_13845 [Desulfobacula sp.]|nr:hypothetical protein [Desulfobacula sp.]